MQQLKLPKNEPLNIQIQLGDINEDKWESTIITACINLSYTWYTLYCLTKSGAGGVVEHALDLNDITFADFEAFIGNVKMLAFNNGCKFVGLEPDAQDFFDDLKNKRI